MNTEPLTSELSMSQLFSRCDLLLERASTIAEFAQEILAVACETAPATCAVVLELSGENIELVAEYNLAELSFSGAVVVPHEDMGQLLPALRKQDASILRMDENRERDLKRHSLIVSRVTGTPLRVIELGVLDELDAEQSRVLQEIAATLAGYLRRFEEDLASRSESTLTPVFWKQFDQFLIKLQQTLDLKQTCAIAANDGRFLIGCDRLSIALKHGGRTRIAAISGQEKVQLRGNLVKTMTQVTNIVRKLGTTVCYRGSADDIPPKLETPLADYLAESRTRMVQISPLREPAPVKLDDGLRETKRKQSPRRILGLMVVEQAIDSRPKAGVLERAELLSAHIETAIANCERYESIFMLPVLRTTGRAFQWFRGRRLWATLAILCAVIATGLGLWLTPWEYRVEGKGLAMPTTQHEVFAPWDADVEELHVESGQRVKAGEILLVLQSDELGAEEIVASNELLEKQKLALSITHRQHAARRKNDAEELAKIEAEFVKTKVEIDGAQARLDKIRQRIQKLTIVAPADGVVATFQLDQLLLNRPVRRGDLLLQIMEPDGPWRLELDIPEYRMGHLVKALNAAPDRKLPVDYVLATAVETSHHGSLTTLATRSNETQANGTIIQAVVEINPHDLPHTNIGADVIAKVHCGQKNLFYVLFGDVIEFLQRTLWF